MIRPLSLSPPRNLSTLLLASAVVLSAGCYGHPFLKSVRFHGPQGHGVPSGVPVVQEGESYVIDGGTQVETLPDPTGVAPAEGSSSRSGN